MVKSCLSTSRASLPCSVAVDRYDATRRAPARSRAAARVKAQASRASAKRAAAQRSAVRKAKPSSSGKARSAPRAKPRPKQQSRPAQSKRDWVKDEVRSELKNSAADVGCESNSFVSGTRVLVRDGRHGVRRVPIEQVKVGDEVIATDGAGRSSAQTVVAAIVGEGSKRLVEVTVRTAGVKPGEAGAVGGAVGRGGSAVVVATDGHPFWVPDARAWVDAGDLQPGQWLQTSAGTWVQVTAVRARTGLLHR